MCIFIKLGSRVSHGGRLIPIAFGGEISKVKATKDIYGNNLVSMVYTVPLCAPASNFVDMLTVIKELSLDYEGQRSNVNVTMDIYGNSVYTI